VFSGIVERTLPFLERDGGRFRFDRRGWDVELPGGSSIAFDGACLTVVEATDDVVGVDVVAETLARTTLGGLQPGDLVNVERSVTLATLLDGGLVLGHVDAVGRVETAADGRLRVEFPERFGALVVEKGTIVVNGVALTVAGLGGSWFEVALIPETERRTNLGRLEAGDLVNLEFDVIGKYVARWHEVGRAAAVEDV